MPLFVSLLVLQGHVKSIYIYMLYVYVYMCKEMEIRKFMLAKGPSIWSLLLLLLLFSWRRCSYGFLLRGWAIDSQDPFFAVKPDLVGNLFLKPFW